MKNTTIVNGCRWHKSIEEVAYLTTQQSRHSCSKHFACSSILTRTLLICHTFDTGAMKNKWMYSTSYFLQPTCVQVLTNIGCFLIWWIDMNCMSGLQNFPESLYSNTNVASSIHVSIIFVLLSRQNLPSKQGPSKIPCFSLCHHSSHQKNIQTLVISPGGMNL